MRPKFFLFPLANIVYIFFVEQEILNEMILGSYNVYHAE